MHSLHSPVYIYFVAFAWINSVTPEHAYSFHFGSVHGAYFTFPTQKNSGSHMAFKLLL